MWDAIVNDQDGRWVPPFIDDLMVMQGLRDGFKLASHLECVLREIGVQLDI